MSRCSFKIPPENEIKRLRIKIMDWSTRHNRDYPWRKTKDPFKVLMAEVMLRRTKPDQVKKVYDKLFQKYSDVESISKAPKDDFEKLLAPLGLNWRIPAFSSIVHEIKEKYDSKVPETREELKALPGVGEYVAGAVLSIGYNKQEWIVDVNVVRLFKRYFGLETSKEGRRDKHIIEIAKIYAKSRNPKKANLALLDFSSLVCSVKPRHEICVLRGRCKYYLDNIESPNEAH